MASVTRKHTLSTYRGHFHYSGELHLSAILFDKDHLLEPELDGVYPLIHAAVAGDQHRLRELWIRDHTKVLAVTEVDLEVLKQSLTVNGALTTGLTTLGFDNCSFLNTNQKFIPPGVVNLTFCNSCDVNSIRDELPDEFPDLKSMDLSGTTMTRDILTEFVVHNNAHRMRSLEYLNLSRTAVDELHPLAIRHLPNLKVLDVRDTTNHFSKAKAMEFLRDWDDAFQSPIMPKVLPYFP